MDLSVERSAVGGLRSSALYRMGVTAASFSLANLVCGQCEMYTCPDGYFFFYSVNDLGQSLWTQASPIFQRNYDSQFG